MANRAGKTFIKFLHNCKDRYGHLAEWEYRGGRYIAEETTCMEDGCVKGNIFRTEPYGVDQYTIVGRSGTFYIDDDGTVSHGVCGFKEMCR